MTIGFVVIDCKTVKSMLSEKHLSISAKLYEALQRNVDHANAITEEFQEIFDRLIIALGDIEGITEMREYSASLPQKIDAMADRIAKNDTYFKLLDEAKWKILLIKWTALGSIPMA